MPAVMLKAVKRPVALLGFTAVQCEAVYKPREALHVPERSRLLRFVWMSKREALLLDS